MIQFTDAAKEKVKEFMAGSGKEGLALRIRIKSRSAQGFEYQFELEEYANESGEDKIVREGGFATRIDPESAKFLKNATVDWVVKDGQPGFAVQNPNQPIPSDSPEELKQDIVESLKTIFDPEIPVNIYDLGLIYAVDLDEEKNATITMTLTAPNCPAAEQLPADVKSKVTSVPGIKSAKVDITWDPPWDMQMMSEAARVQLNL